MQHKSLQWLQQHFSSDETRNGWKIEYAPLLLPSLTLLNFEVMYIKRQTVWYFRRPNVNTLKPQKGGQIYKI